MVVCSRVSLLGKLSADRMSAKPKVRKGISKIIFVLVSATKKVFWKIQTFPSLSWSKKLVMAIVTAWVIMAIVTVLDIGRLRPRDCPGYQNYPNRRDRIGL